MVMTKISIDGQKNEQRKETDEVAHDNDKDKSTTVKSQAVSKNLHRNLLDDIQAGKLGYAPQVVIVHPDGSLEEVSSNLPVTTILKMCFLSIMCKL